MKRLESYWYGNSYFVDILDKKKHSKLYSFHCVILDFIPKTFIVMSYSSFKSNAENAYINAWSNVKYINYSIGWYYASNLTNSFVHFPFYPRPTLGFGYCFCLRLSVCVCVCPSVCVSVKPELVQAITHHAFKLEPPNLDKICTTTWLRSLLFGGRLTLTFKVKFNLRNKFALFWACPQHDSSLKLEPPNLDKRCKPTCLWTLLFGGGGEDWP